MAEKDYNKIANFLFELGGMRTLPRIHMQTLLTHDLSDNISSHSYRVAMIGWILAYLEGVDESKVIKMCLVHDITEIRSGDHNWVHKRYVKIFEDEIKEEQLGNLSVGEIKEVLDEYDKRESREAIVAKDADILDQILLLREYEAQGNKEATTWLRGKVGENRDYAKVEELKTTSAQTLGKLLYHTDPSDWFKEVWTNKNR